MLSLALGVHSGLMRTTFFRACAENSDPKFPFRGSRLVQVLCEPQWLPDA